MESLTHVCLFVEKPLVDRFCLAFKAQTQRCKVLRGSGASCSYHRSV